MNPATLTMLTEILTTLGGLAALGLFMWRLIGRTDRKIDDLAKDHRELARELSELRGEIRGRFGKPEIQPAE